MFRAKRKTVPKNSCTSCGLHMFTRSAISYISLQKQDGADRSIDGTNNEEAGTEQPHPIPPHPTLLVVPFYIDADRGG